MLGEISLYFHLPFCHKKCPYCHFFVLPNKKIFHEKLIDALKLEWDKKLHLLKDKRLTSVYFGGGTPFLFPYIDKLLKMIKPPKGIEITLECNPEDIDEKAIDRLKKLHKLGVNRVSLGVQSLIDEELVTLGRNHSAQDAIDAIYRVKASGISNITLDLMYEIPHQTPESFSSTLKKVEPLPITHVSLYNLTIEERTHYHKIKDQILPHIPKEKVGLEMLNMAIDSLEKYGLKRYEISAFAKANKKSVHNLGYWQGRDFLGYGPAAFSYFDEKRFRNTANLNKYAKELEKHKESIDFTEKLPYPENIHELIAVNLRVLEGVDLKKFYPLPESTKEKIDNLLKDQLIEKDGSRIFLTQKGTLFYDLVGEEFVS